MSSDQLSDKADRMSEWLRAGGLELEPGAFAEVYDQDLYNRGDEGICLPAELEIAAKELLHELDELESTWWSTH